jgi:hypothetical protein
MFFDLCVSCSCANKRRNEKSGDATTSDGIRQNEHPEPVSGSRHDQRPQPGQDGAQELEEAPQRANVSTPSQNYSCSW